MPSNAGSEGQGSGRWERIFEEGKWVATKVVRVDDKALAEFGSLLRPLLDWGGEKRELGLIFGFHFVFIPSPRQSFIGIWRWNLNFSFFVSLFARLGFGVGFTFLFLAPSSCCLLKSFYDSPSVFVNNDMLTNESLIDLELRIDLNFQTRSRYFQCSFICLLP